MTGNESKERFTPKQREFIKWFLQVTNEADPPSDEKPLEDCDPPPWKLPNLFARAPYFNRDDG
jgi:hypothetical protein